MPVTVWLELGDRPVALPACMVALALIVVVPLPPFLRTVPRFWKTDAVLKPLVSCRAASAWMRNWAPTALVIDPESNGYHPREALRMPGMRPGIVPVSEVLRIVGPHAATIQKVVPDAYVAETFEQAVAFSRETTVPIATINGDVFRGSHLVSGGAKAESRGILATKREIKELRERIASDRAALAQGMTDTQFVKDVCVVDGDVADDEVSFKNEREHVFANVACVNDLACS